MIFTGKLAGHYSILWIRKATDVQKVLRSVASATAPPYLSKSVYFGDVFSGCIICLAHYKDLITIKLTNSVFEEGKDWS